MRQITLKAAALLLIMASMLSIAACGRTNSDDTPEYHYELTSLSADISLLGILDMAMVDETPYLLAYDGTYQTGIYRLELETGTLIKICDASCAIAIAPDRHGGLWMLESFYDEDSETSTPALKRLDTDGTTVGSAEITVDCQYVTGIVTDSNGNLYICDIDKILLIDANGTYTGAVEASGYLLVQK